jgi:hypothetical protein
MKIAGKVSNVTNLPKLQETLGAQGFLCGQVSGRPVQNGQDNALISRELWIDDSDSQAANLGHHVTRRKIFTTVPFKASGGEL